MKWCDLLRVKSEFPINLWPNAVQAYQRWIRDALRTNMPYDRMARELLTSSGSNFRVPQVNFYRAVQGREPQPLAAAVALTFMGSAHREVAGGPPRRHGGLFSRVSYKPTAEWKEEIVCLDPAPMGPAGGGVAGRAQRCKVAPGADPREVFADWLVAPGQPAGSRGPRSNRTWAWMLGRGIVHEPDDLRPDNPPAIPDCWSTWSRNSWRRGYDPNNCCALILNSRIYQLSSIATQRGPARPRRCSPPIRSGGWRRRSCSTPCAGSRAPREGYYSPIPEPFTYIPASDQRAVNLARRQHHQLVPGNVRPLAARYRLGIRAQQHAVGRPAAAPAQLVADPEQDPTTARACSKSWITTRAKPAAW